MTSPYVSVSVKCAECGKVKGEGNHWFVVVTPDANRLRAIAGGLAFSINEAILVYMGSPVLYWVTGFDPTRNSLNENEYPVCGESCLNKLTSKILSEKKPCAA